MDVPLFASLLSEFFLCAAFALSLHSAVALPLRKPPLPVLRLCFKQERSPRFPHVSSVSFRLHRGEDCPASSPLQADGMPAGSSPASLSLQARGWTCPFLRLQGV